MVYYELVVQLVSKEGLDSGLSVSGTSPSFQPFNYTGGAKENLSMTMNIQEQNFQLFVKLNTFMSNRLIRDVLQQMATGSRYKATRSPVSIEINGSPHYVADIRNIDRGPDEIQIQRIKDCVDTTGTCGFSRILSNGFIK